jgi:hypothetical protein
MKTITNGIRVTDTFYQDNKLPAELPIQPLGFFVNQVDAHSGNIDGLETIQTSTPASVASQSRFVQPLIRHGAIESSLQAQGGTQEPCDADSKIDTKTWRTFTSASSATEAQLVQALIRYGRSKLGADPMNSRATHDGTKDFFGRTGPSPRLISWLTDAAVFISAQPSRAARRHAFEAKLREWNEFHTRRSIELARESLRWFYVNVDNIGLKSEVHAKRAMMELESWQREVEQLFQGLYIIYRGRRQVLGKGDNLARLMHFSAVKAPELRLMTPDEGGRDFRANLEVEWNRSVRVERAPQILAANRDQFYEAMSARMRSWFGRAEEDELFDLDWLNAEIEINPMEDAPNVIELLPFDMTDVPFLPDEMLDIAEL